MPEQQLTPRDVLMGTEARKVLYGPDERNGTISRAQTLGVELGPRVLVDLFRENIGAEDALLHIRSRARYARRLALRGVA